VRLAAALKGTEGHVHPRPPSFCTGCPERPIFTALKLVERELGSHHVSCDIGCHLFSILPPFNIGATTMGYGLGGAGAAAFNTKSNKRAISFVGDGGFWHNGLTSSIGNAVFNKSDNVTVIVDNGYTSATGGQDILSSYNGNTIRKTQNSIEKAVRGVGVDWVRTITHTYDVAQMRDTLREALTTTDKGPKVIVAQSECMLNKQRRVRPLMNKAIKDGNRVVRERFGVDPDTCTGDHSCIRLSGCPSLTVAPNPDPLRVEPVTKVINSCVGCGLCGEVAHAGRAVPVVLSRLDRQQSERLGPLQGEAARRRDRLPAAANRAAPVRRDMNAPFPQRQRPITIAILAMGGEGGGVLADWIIDLAENNHYIAQLTSVPGVAQRTGATIYYLEIYPRAGIADPAHEPVLALMPVPGDVDIVVASELMEAGRAIPARADHAGPHHVGGLDQPCVLDDRACRDGRRARRCRETHRGVPRGGKDNARVRHGGDRRGHRQRDQRGAVRALAGAGVLPFPRQAFEGAIKRGGVGIKASLAAFTAGFEATTSGTATVKAPATTMPPPTSTDRIPTRRRQSPRRTGRSRLSFGRERKSLPPARAIVRAGIERTVDYQGLDYAKLYLERLAADRACRQGRPPHRRDRAAARARHGVRGHDPRRRAEDPPVALSTACAAKCASTTSRSSRSPSSCIRARRRSPTRSPPRSGGSSSTPAGCVA
jgi:Pyruvate/2-oxoacid:ferredoxin oxidoreductase gamma subunit/pyruvate/2-oxoacid:ferredoxin oxidoreductase beta subunit